MDTAVQAIARRIPLTQIVRSNTQIQQLRRAHFNAAKITELAESIKAQGQLQPILVRPMRADALVTQRVPEDPYEIIAGERRFLACREAGLTEIYAIVRNLTDAQVLEAQLVENLQREGVHPLEEAEGYAELMRLKGINADELGAQIGKSRAYVYARLKLRDLCPEARAKLDAGELDASKALVIARLSPKLQEKILKDYRGQTDPDSSYRAFVDRLDNFTTDMAAAPFTPADTTLTLPGNRKTGPIPLPACATCPHNSDNDAELKADLGGQRLCLDRECYDAKCKAVQRQKREAALASQKTILTGDDARRALVTNMDNVGAEYVALDATCDQIEFDEPEPEDTSSPEWEAWITREIHFRAPTFRQLIGAAEIETLYADHKGELIELAPVKDVAEILKLAHKIKLDIPKPERAGSRAAETAHDPAAAAEAQRKEEERQQRELAYRRAIFMACAPKAGFTITQAEIIEGAQTAHNRVWDEGNALMLEALGLEKLNAPVIAKMKTPDALKVWRLSEVADSVVNIHHNLGELLALAKQCKVDVAKIKKQLAAADKAAKKPASAPAKKKAAKK